MVTTALPRDDGFMSTSPPAYLIANITVHDPEGYAEYRSLAGATVAAHGGRYVVRGGTTDSLEGDPPSRVVVLEFPSMEAARGWYSSAEYQHAARIRQGASTSQIFFVEGAPSD